MTIAYHRFAEEFPLIEGQDFIDFVDDIRQHGLRKPIDIFEACILDGRNRYRALEMLASTGECLGPGWADQEGSAFDAAWLELDLESPLFHQFKPEVDGNPLDYVASLNLRRRDLTVGQRAMAVAGLGRLGWGGDRSKPSGEGLSTERRAEIGRVGRATVERAETVIDHGTTELGNAVRQNVIPVSVAAEVAVLPIEQQKEIVLKLEVGADGKLTKDARKQLAPIIKAVRAEKQKEKKARRDEREETLGRKILAMPENKYGVAIEDFEWDHEPWSRETGMDRHPSNHYPTAADAHTPEEIVARTAERIRCLAEDCVLYYWTTIPHEKIAHKVLELRGFEYKSQRCWFKVRPGKGRGPGYWVTGEHEILLIAVRGKVVPPTNAHFRSSFHAPVGEHSEKPDEQYEHAEFHYPNIPKIEINARRRRPGWAVWGYEAPDADGEVSA